MWGRAGSSATVAVVAESSGVAFDLGGVVAMGWAVAGEGVVPAAVRAGGLVGVIVGLGMEVISAGGMVT